MYFDVPRRITGHRGSGANHVVQREIENTAVSCRLALAHGADSVEIDVQVSGDDKLVVYHYARTPDGLRVAEQPLNQLQALGIETLAELTTALPSHSNGMQVGLNLELKTGYDRNELKLDHRVADALTELLPTLTARYAVLLSSFDPIVLGRYRVLRDTGTATALPFSYVCAHPHRRDRTLPVTVSDGIIEASKLGADAVHLNAGQLGLGPPETDPQLTELGQNWAPQERIAAAVAAARDAGLALNVWCPEPEDAAILLRAGVDGVCVNWVPETVSRTAELLAGAEPTADAIPVQAATPRTE